VLQNFILNTVSDWFNDKELLIIHANSTDLRGSLPNFKVFYRLPILDVFLPIKTKM
jgi:hypothetical protein